MASREYTDVRNALVSETRRALAAAKRIPVQAARVGFDFLVNSSPVYSGGFRASISVGIGGLPPLPAELAALTDDERHRRAREGDIFDPPDISQVLDLARDYELGDVISIGSDIRYADLVDARTGGLLSEQLDQIVELELERGIAEFNRRSEAAVRGTGGEVF